MPDQRITVLSHLPLALLDRVRDEFGDLDWVAVPSEGDLEEGFLGEVLLTLPWGTPNLGHVIERGVKWVHTIGTGVDRFPTEHLGDRIWLTHCIRLVFWRRDRGIYIGFRAPLGGREKKG